MPPSAVASYFRNYSRQARYGDPDIIRCNGKKLYFMSIVLKGKRYVLTHDEVDSTEREMLTLFFEEDFGRYFETLPGVEQPTSENQ